MPAFLGVLGQNLNVSQYVHMINGPWALDFNTSQKRAARRRVVTGIRRRRSVRQHRRLPGTDTSHQTAGAAVFLDRDGVLVEELGIVGKYLTRPSELRLLPGAADAVRRLNDAGVPVLVITNQAAIAHGLMTMHDLHRIHRRLKNMLRKAAGAKVDKFYYCPYHPNGIVSRYARHSDSRKPGAGMLLKAAADFDLDLSRCFLVGDKETDMIAAMKVGCKAVAVSTRPYGLHWPSWKDGRPGFAARDLAAAVKWIMEQRHSNLRYRRQRSFK